MDCLRVKAKIAPYCATALQAGAWELVRLGIYLSCELNSYNNTLHVERYTNKSL